MMEKQITIQYSFFSDTIAKQLKKQKVDFDKETAKKHQQIANAILLLRFHELVTDKYADSLLKKNHDELIKALNKHGNSNQRPKISHS